MSADGGIPPPDLSCPFCAEPIRAGAVVCRHCRRDISIPLPLMLAQREQKAEIERLREQVTELSAALALVGTAAAPAEAPAAAARRREMPSWLAPLFGWCLALALVVGAHWLLVIRTDAAVIVLRAACILLPFAVAAGTPGLWRVPSAPLAVAGLALGLVAVGLMSWVVSVHDDTPIVPTTRRDLFEALEFALSIGLSFFAGGLAAKALRREPEDRSLAVARALRGTSVEQVAARSTALKTLTENATLLAASAGALATGFRRLLE
ncbi:hypothetical protein J5Y09_11330 [Roseomonas sp. PWR1]|uniref:Zinc ribbon domain-containing protein n=1 Tax=Roseomonas nitratireducens TaxID=2820810 RepID=A0ABS4AT13_9PROT|nr:hypothetical protein [Neoroseomonas nitratireducens]MBP0464498.1 hypothetical protein [Neoroseomonas nitratireducens]